MSDRNLKNKPLLVAIAEEANLISDEPNAVYPSHDDEEAWTRINDQRIALIRKQLDHGLTMHEHQLLDHLEAAMSDHNDVIASLPWGMLDNLDAAIRRIKEMTR